MINRIKYCFFSIFFLCSLYTQKIDQQVWVDSIYSSMSLDQKVGQLYSVWTASKYGQEEINEIKRIINEYHIGGLIFSLGNINDQIISHNIFQEQSNIPLLISMDAEWGLGMRLDDGFSFPYNITLGAIRDESLVFAVGQRIGEHLKKIGVHLKPIDFHRSIKEKDSVVVDMRNYYESEVGRFKNAITPNAHSSKELLPKVAKILIGNEDKKVHLYCTGGIRCEKASSYLIKNGFQNVNQLQGGIIQYAHDVKEKDMISRFKGKNFVFDDRLGERVTDDILASCHLCGTSCDEHTDCNNDACHLSLIHISEPTRPY